MLFRGFQVDGQGGGLHDGKPERDENVGTYKESDGRERNLKGDDGAAGLGTANYGQSVAF